ncbi:MAG: superoxide dismutase, Ni [Pseudomonadota bacterium]
MNLNKLIAGIDRVAGFEAADAHCDIPCKIYDPSTAQIAALTMLRMVDLIQDTEKAADGNLDTKALNSMVRFIDTKEEHGRAVKDEVRVIWGDYFKTPQFEQFPEIHELTHSIMLLASACKQHVDREKTLQLIEAVNRFAEIFWATKNVATKRAECPYPPSVEVVYPDL